MTPDDAKGAQLDAGPWVDVADEDSLRRHGRCLVRVAGQDVAVFAVDEELFAVDDSCFCTPALM